MARATVTVRNGPNAEEPESGIVKISFGMLFLGSKKKAALRNQTAAPEVSDGTIVHLKLSPLRKGDEDQSIDLHFDNPTAAAEKQAQCLEEYAKAANRKGKPSPKTIDLPGTGAARSDSAASAPVKASRPRSEPAGRVDDLELFSQQNHLHGSASVSTPNAGDAAAREAKRRHIDSHCTTISGSTPEKVGRMQFTPMKRAAPPRSSLLTVCTKRPAAPQGSSSYGGYRSSLTFGLRNLGNTCYLNAVLQACCSLREFVRDLRTMSKTLPSTQESTLYRCTVEILQQMSLASSGGVAGPLSPTKLREHIGLQAPMFRGNEQQDAHEFFLEFVNQLHDELLAARNQWLGQTPEATSEAPSDMGIPATQLHLDSEVHKQLVCVQCQSQREVAERFRDFSLDFVGHAGGERCSLPDMLRAYFNSELLEAKCEQCGAVAAHMDKQLTSPPRVLVLHLKRFTPNLEKQRYDKQHQSVQIPTRLDLNAVLGGVSTVAPDGTPGRSPPRLPARPLAAAAAERAAPTAAAASVGGATVAASAGGAAAADRGGSASSEIGSEACATSPSRGLAAPMEVDSGTASSGPPGLWYNLRAVVAHDGSSPHCGHYTCYARGEDNSWRLYDDSIVREVPGGEDLQRVLGRQAYIVFYVLQAADAKA